GALEIRVALDLFALLRDPARVLFAGPRALIAAPRALRVAVIHPGVEPVRARAVALPDHLGRHARDPRPGRNAAPLGHDRGATHALGWIFWSGLTRRLRSRRARARAAWDRRGSRARSSRAPSRRRSRRRRPFPSPPTSRTRRGGSCSAEAPRRASDGSTEPA